jgi:oligopeptide/dipeptide ABC transporter ATP-binding protein
LSAAGSTDSGRNRGEDRQALLELKDLRKDFVLEGGLWSRIMGGGKVLHAVDGVDLTVRQGETLGLVGESGSGKSTLARCVVRLYEPTAGAMLYRGADVRKLKGRGLVEYRKKVQMIFQDPYSSLDPRTSIGSMLGEILDYHHLVHSEAEKKARVNELINSVGLDLEHLGRYPHEFSGGQRQRLSVARALALSPELLIADESVSALDVSVGAQILNLFEEIQKKFHLTILFISHDLSVVSHISDRVAVMYLGKVVEVADSFELFANPQHPYTQALISAVPRPDPDAQSKEIILKGEVPTAVDVPPGCRFHPRCAYATEVCKRVEPQLLQSKDGHFVACHLVNPVPESGGKKPGES